MTVGPWGEIGPGTKCEATLWDTSGGIRRAVGECQAEATCLVMLTRLSPMWPLVAEVPGYEKATFRHVPMCGECRDRLTTEGERK